MSRFIFTGLAAAALFATVACDPAAKVDREATDVAEKQIEAKEKATELAVKQDQAQVDLLQKQAEDRAKLGAASAEGIAEQKKDLTNAVIDLKGERASLHTDLMKRLDQASAELRKAQTDVISSTKTVKSEFDARLDMARSTQTKARAEIDELTRTEDTLVKTAAKNADTAVDTFEKAVSEVKGAIKN